MGEWLSELSQMMWGLGDGERVNPRTALLVEEQVRQELRGIINECKELRGALDVVGLLFQLRRDPGLLHRLISFLRARDLGKVASAADPDAVESLDPVSTGGREGRFLKAAREALEIFDVTGELLELTEDCEMENLKKERLSRAAERAAAVSVAEHQRLTQASAASFVHSRNGARFIHWLSLPSEEENIKIGSVQLEILGFIGKEIVAKLTETALQIKESCGDGKGRVGIGGGLSSSPIKSQSQHGETRFILAEKIRERAGGREYLKGIGIDVVSSRQLQPEHIVEAVRRIHLANPHSNSILFVPFI